jgi:hypothetical protein
MNFANPSAGHPKLKRTAALGIALATLAALAAAGASAARACDCPEVSVTCPDSVKSGGGAAFEANVEGAAAGAKLTYKWTVSAGTITGGQGTNRVEVDTTGLNGGEVTATVEVGGFPESCTAAASCTTSVIPQPIIDNKIDEYGRISFDDEQARLDNFAIELQNDPTAEGYLICYGGRVGRAREAVRRCARAKAYLSGYRHIPAARIVTVDGGYREDLTVELWYVSAGMTPPHPSPSVDPKEVRFVKAGPKRGRRRR